MDALQLIKAVNAEVAANRAVAFVDGERVIVARVVGDQWVLTDDGQAMAASVKPAPEPVPEAKPTKSKTTKASAPETES